MGLAELGSDSSLVLSGSIFFWAEASIPGEDSGLLLVRT